MILILIMFLFGLIFGSFLNVCIHRMPQDESIVSPGSHCPKCKKPIKWYDNIPMLSFILLRAKCRYCSEPISFRYFLVEFGSGMAWISIYFLYGFSGYFWAGIVLISILLSVSVIDLETGLIPDKFTIPGMLIGMVLCGFFPELQHQTQWNLGVLHSFFGLIVGGGSLLAIGLIGNIIFKKESMGGGDVKLFALLGAFLGVKKVILVLLFAPFASMPFALYVKLAKKGETIPFGPFIAMTGAWFFLYGENFSSNFFNF